MTASRLERTHEQLISCALGLFERQGFEHTTVAQVAAAAGVTEMTFFRHFSSKDAVILTDPYDPTIADGIAAQPLDAPALIRAARGVRRALSALSEPESDVVRRRIRIIARSDELRARSIASNGATQKRIGDQLIADGADVLVARAAAAAILAALTAVLFEWARDEGMNLPIAINVGLRALEGNDE